MLLSFPFFVSQTTQTGKSDSFEKHRFHLNFTFCFYSFFKTYFLFWCEFIISFTISMTKDRLTGRSFITMINYLISLAFPKIVGKLFCFLPFLIRHFLYFHLVIINFSLAKLSIISVSVSVAFFSL